MRKITPSHVSLLLLLCATQAIYAQTVNEVLRKGKVIRKEENLFLSADVNSRILSYSIGENPGTFKLYPDSTIFLPKDETPNVYVQVLNPLNFSYDNTVTQVPDPIAADADKALGAITSFFTTNIQLGPPKAGTAPSATTTCNCTLCDISKFLTSLRDIQGGLATDPKVSINNAFNALKKLDFENQAKTENDKKAVQDTIDVLTSFFNDLWGKIGKFQSKLDSFPCTSQDSLVNKYVLTQLLTEIQTSYKVKRTRLDNLVKAKKLVDDAFNAAVYVSVKGKVWFGDPGIFVSVQDKKIAIVTLTINKSGWEVNSDGEIVASTKTLAYTRVLRFRKFERFIIEASGGVAYTNLSFPKYGTATNAAGQMEVAQAGQENFKKVDFTAMANWVYYANSSVNPLIQIGVGSNADYPVLLAGIGVRFNFVGSGRLSLSFGAASSWIKSLNKLHVGSIISGTADLENDYTHEFKAPERYFGIQYNF